MRGILLVLLAAMLWGTTGTSQALAPANATPLGIGAIRLLVGSLVLLIYAIWQNGWRLFTGLSSGALLTAAICMAAYQPLFFAGVDRTGVAVGTIVTIGSAPILSGGIVFLTSGIWPGSRWVLATLVSLFGCSLLIFSAGSLTFEPVGVFFALMAGSSYAVFAVASKALLTDKPPEVIMAIVFLIAALLLIPALFFVDLSWLTMFRGWVVAAHLGLGTVALAYVLFAYGLRNISVAAATTISLAEPATAAGLAVFVLGEQLTTRALLGMCLVGIGLVILSVQRPTQVR